MIYALMLNDMREPNIENLQAVKVSERREELVDFYNEEHVGDDFWKDGNWSKSFKKGGPLEWYNPADLSHDNEYFGGIYQMGDLITLESAMQVRLVKAH